MAWIRRWMLVWMVGGLTLLSGCCSWCDRHCTPRYAPVAPVAPAYYGAAQPGMCCPPCPAPNTAWSNPSTLPPCRP
jgi:hypothetical protein